MLTRKTGRFAQTGHKVSTVTQVGRTVTRQPLRHDADVLARLQVTLAAMPDIDYPRVIDARSAIASGRYPINPTAIANELLRADRELG